MRGACSRGGGIQIEGSLSVSQVMDKPVDCQEMAGAHDYCRREYRGWRADPANR